MSLCELTYAYISTFESSVLYNTIRRRLLEYHLTEYLIIPTLFNQQTLSKFYQLVMQLILIVGL